MRRALVRRAFGLAAGFVFVSVFASPLSAADLGLRSGKSVVRIHRTVVVRAVRDYDGTPIVMRRRPDGIYETYLAMRATPSRYLNGQRVMP